MRERNVIKSPRLSELKRKRRQVIIIKICAIFFSVAIIITLLALVSRISKLNISEINTSGNSIIDTEAIREVANKEMEGNYLWVFPKTNIFLYPKNSIKDAVAHKFKRLINIDLSVNSGRVLDITAGERIPKYTWCGPTPAEEGEGGRPCYFMDETGYIFDVAPYFSGEVYFKFYGTPTPEDDSPSEAREAGDVSGSYFFKDNFNKLLDFRDTIRSMGLKPAAYYVNDTEDARLLLSSGENATIPEIIFKTYADTEKVAENLQASISTEPLETDIKKKYSSLLYIDLRYGNKVFYKFR